MNFQSDCRAAAVTTLGAYATAANVALNVYRGRPRSVKPPHAFVDRLSETITYVGHMMQRTVQVEVVILWGLFDSGEATDQRDAFVDGYTDYLRDQVDFAAAGANTTFGVASSEDEPNYVTDWIAPSERSAVVYFATRMTLEGYAGD